LLPAGANRRVGLAPTGKRRLVTAHPPQQPFLSPVTAGPCWVQAGGKFSVVVEGQGGASLAVLSPRGQSSRGSQRTFINYISTRQPQYL